MAFPDLTFGGASVGDVAGVTPVTPYGQREQFLFGGIWTVGDFWTIEVASTSGNITLGAGTFSKTVNNLPVGLTPTVCFTYKQRVYVGLGPEFAFSDNNAPTQFEEQAPGAGFVPYLSQYGGQDSVVAFSQLQGRLAVFANQTIQIWATDADPANFAIQQALDNAGTPAPLSVQALGDYDVLYLDLTGFRSLRAKEVTLNAYVDDGIGSPVDDFIQAITQSGVSLAGACGITDPQTKNYWCYVNGTIFVLSRSLGGKIQAWSTYLPTDDTGVTFTPQKFVVFRGQVFCRSVEGGDFSYGGLNAAQYDNTIAIAVTPYYDDKKADIMKQSLGVQAVLAGQWDILVSTDPKSGGNDPSKYHTVFHGGAPLVPQDTADSTYDIGIVPYEDRATHFSFMMRSTQPQAIATFSSITLHYNRGEDVS